MQTEEELKDSFPWISQKQRKPSKQPKHSFRPLHSLSPMYLIATIENCMSL